MLSSAWLLKFGPMTVPENAPSLPAFKRNRRVASPRQGSTAISRRIGAALLDDRPTNRRPSRENSTIASIGPKIAGLECQSKILRIRCRRCLCKGQTGTMQERERYDKRKFKHQEILPRWIDAFHDGVGCRGDAKWEKELRPARASIDDARPPPREDARRYGDRAVAKLYRGSPDPLFFPAQIARARLKTRGPTTRRSSPPAAPA